MPKIGESLRGNVYTKNKIKEVPRKVTGLSPAEEYIRCRRRRHRRRRDESGPADAFRSFSASSLGQACSAENCRSSSRTYRLGLRD